MKLGQPDKLLSLPKQKWVCRDNKTIGKFHLTDIPPLDYQRHLFRERVLRSVTANTREDGEEFLRVAAAMPLQVHHQQYPLDAADLALTDLAADRVDGAAVLVV